MSRSLRFLAILLAIFMIAQRSPAPIVEPTENPTPGADGQAQPKHSSKSKRKNAEDSEQNKATEATKPKERFAGTWSGKINAGIWGNIPVTLTLSAGGSQVTEHSGFGTYSHAATSNRQTATWKSGLLNEVTWTFTPNSGGNSAQVTAKSALGVNGNSTFHRVSR